MSGDPRDTEAERYTLAGMLTGGPAEIEGVGELLTPDDFYLPVHQIIYRAMLVMHAAGDVISVVTLREWIVRDGDAQAFSGPIRCGEYILDLWGLPVAGSAVAHARIVADRSGRRRLDVAARRMLQRVQDRSETLAEVRAACQNEIDAAVSYASALDGPAEDVMSAQAFIDSPRAQPRPVIPGLVNREDRVVLVGRAGSGKTMLIYQVACASAAGVHPFAWTPMEPIRSLIVDLEQPRYLVRSKLMRMVAVAERQPAYAIDSVQVISRPGGIDLTKADEAHYLASRIRHVKPDLIIAGPIYKMYTEAGELGDHAAVSAFWDKMRERYGCTLWLETHSPLAGGIMRPRGSGLWTQWPEFGVALLPAPKSEPRGALTVSTFRGDREEGRLWPIKLHRNCVPGGWPWAPIYPDGAFGRPMEGTDV